jgi:hypothetical protein
MGKCVIEAPRRGSSAGSYKVRHYGKFVKTADGLEYEGPTRIPSRMGDDKDFSDKLGPLRGYLRKACGRPWNDVYSEIAVNIGRSGSEGIRHIIDVHLDVAVDCWYGVDGRVYENKYGERLVGQYRSDAVFYVEPGTGILRQAPKYKREYPEPKVEVVQIDANSEYRLIAGIWYHQAYTTVEDKIFAYVDSATGLPVYRYENRSIMISKKQLNKKELKCLNARIAAK